MYKFIAADVVAGFGEVKYDAMVSLSEAGDRCVVFFDLSKSSLVQLPDLVESDKNLPGSAECILLDALRIGLEYLWRRDSDCECICQDEDADGVTLAGPLT